jgi:tetratricopeptide (TPR) repeat protein
LAAIASYLTCSLSSLASKVQGPIKDYPQATRDLIQRLDSLLSSGDYAAAESLIRALVTRRHALDFAESLNRLARTYRHKGDYSAAELLLRWAVALHRQPRSKKRSSDSESSNHHVKSLNQLADLYRTLGNYPSAESLLRQALEIHPHSRDSHDSGSLSNYVKTLSNLADLYRHMGDYASAEPLLHRAVESCRASVGEDHPDYATALNYLANFSRSTGKHAAAEPLLRRAVEIHRIALGENHPHHAASLTNLANLYRSMGNHASAEPLLRRAVEIHRVALGEWHPEHARSLARMAYLYREMQNYEDSRLHGMRSLAIFDSVGSRNLEHVKILLNMIRTLISAGRVAEALPLLDRWRIVENGCTGQCFSIASESQRAEYLSALRTNMFVLFSIILQHLDGFPAAIRSGIDLVLQRKALASEALSTQRDVLLGGKYPALGPRLRRLAALRMQIARKTLAGPGPEGLDSHLRGLAEWNADKEGLEAELARQIPEMNLERTMRAVDRFAIARGLPEEAALIEFVLVLVCDLEAKPRGDGERWKGPVYVALIIPAGGPDNVQMINLGEADRIDHLIADFRARIIGAGRADDGRDMSRRRDQTRPVTDGDPGSALREALFDPLIPYLGGRTRLLIAPDGDLTRLPFEVLPTADGGRLIDDYQMSYLSCGRDILRFGAKVTGEASQPLVIADPDFDLQDTAVPTPARSRSAFWSRLPG